MFILKIHEYNKLAIHKIFFKSGGKKQYEQQFIYTCGGFVGCAVVVYPLGVVLHTK